MQMRENTPAADPLSSRYDETPYVSAAFAPSSPDNLSVIGVLAGLKPPPVNHCRVLEIGCASGGNLLPLAQLLPHSTFIGIDLSARQIEQGRELCARAGLRNVELRAQNILDFADQEPFDYVIAHGVYSWVPAAVREHVMNLCRRWLSPSGLAYLSYNTLPGWHAKRISRDMMLFHARGAQTSQQRIARAREIMTFATGNLPVAESACNAALRQLAPTVASTPDWLLEHDDLELFNEPVYFEDFVKHAKSHHLRYLGGAQPHMNLFQQLAAPLRQQLQAFTNDPIALEQYADFVLGTQYRDAVLCREDAPISSNSGAAAVQNMYVAGWLVEEPIQSPKVQHGAVRFVNPLQKREMVVSEAGSIAALRRVGQSWPHAVHFADLLGTATGGRNGSMPSGISLANFLSTQFLSAYATNFLELWTRPTDFLAIRPSHPCVAPFARMQGQAGDPITNLRHQQFRLVDPFIKKFIGFLDGSRDHTTLIEQLMRGAQGTASPAVGVTETMRTQAHELLVNVLQTLSERSLLIAKQ